jgi:hypothetical protein
LARWPAGITSAVPMFEPVIAPTIEALTELAFAASSRALHRLDGAPAYGRRLPDTFATGPVGTRITLR